MAPIHDVYERYAADVYRFALYLSGEPADAEDITADTFVRLWTAPGEIRTATVKAYLFTIARHLYLDRQRARARLTELDDSMPSSTPNAEDRAAARSEVDHVRRAIARLPATDRAALLTHFAVPASRDFVKALQSLASAATTIEIYEATKVEKL